MNFYFLKNVNTEVVTCNETPWSDAWPIDRKNGNSEKCPRCGRHVSMLKWLDPKRIRLTNSRFPDRLVYWLNEPLVVSSRFKEAFEQENLTGIKLFSPVEVVEVSRLKNGAIVPTYFCAEIEYQERVKINVDETLVDGQKCDWSCELCNPLGTTIDNVKRIALDLSEWDELDVFRVYSLGLFVSQRFYDLVNKYRFTNFEFVAVKTNTIK